MAASGTSGDSVPHFDIPKKCKGAVVKDEGPNFRVEVEEVDVPEIGPEDVLIKLNATGICHSDIHFMANDWGLAPMSYFKTQCAGHEGAGVIVKVGDGVKKLKLGMRAGYKPICDTCGACELCRSGLETYCDGIVITGLHCDGSYKQYVRSPERYTTIIPDGVSDHIAGPVMCSASTIYSSLKDAALCTGDWAVFPGGGAGVGIQGVQLAVAMGLRAIVVDTGDEREKLVKEYGAEHFVDFKAGNPVEEVIKICDGIGAHGVFVTAPQAYPISLDYLGRRAKGKVMCIGIPPVETCKIDLAPSRLVFRGQSLQGTLVSTLGEVDEALKFAARGKLRLQPTVVGLSKFNEAVQLLKEGKVAGRMVVDFNID